MLCSFSILHFFLCSLLHFLCAIFRMFKLTLAFSSPTFCFFSGMYTGGFLENKHGVLSRVSGPFTPSQWLELECQTLIYKYIVANVAIPPNLLISVSRDFGFPPFSVGYFSSNTCKTSILMANARKQFSQLFCILLLD